MNAEEFLKRDMYATETLYGSLQNIIPRLAEMKKAIGVVDDNEKDASALNLQVLVSRTLDYAEELRAYIGVMKS